MYKTSSEVPFIIITVVLVLVIIGVFVLAMLIYFNNRKLQGIREQERLKKSFEQALLQTQLEVQEQTMRHISQEIHDNIGQILSLVNLNLKTLVAGDKDKLDYTGLLVNKAITDLRSLSKSLHPESIGKKGLNELLSEELNLLDRTGNFKTCLSIDDDIILPPGKLIILYRMIQEVLNNIIKHSEASEVNIDIKDAKLSIADNGKGFLPGCDTGGLGLQNLHQRAKVIGAEVDIQTKSGKGTIVIFSFDK